MLETMQAAQGIGLAAPQVGVARRLAVVDVSHDPDCITFLRVDGEAAKLEDWMPLVFVNPEVELREPRETEPEGCLSIRDVRAEVKRPTGIRARLQLLDGRSIELETDGLLARALQHEIDHLNGVLFIDRISPAAKVRLKRTLKRLAAEA
jgi:peptide deformylase